MNPAESAYWDSVAHDVKLPSGTPRDNIWKRCAIVSRILMHRPIGARVLEIGIGVGTAAAVVQLCTFGKMKYIGTDVSAEFCKHAENRWQLRTVQTDVLALPDGPFDMVWAFDTLEHVRPEDREAGNAEIARVLAKHAVIMLNVPLSESSHDMNFDFPYAEKEVLDLAKATNTRIAKWEMYDIDEINRSYLWVELIR